ncbi:MAG: peptidylprolyl isomerase [Syntrophobacteraceae bacterium]
MGKHWLWLLLVLMITGACGEPVPDEVVRYKGGNLTIQDLNAHAQKIAGKKEYAENPERLTADAVLRHAINMEMLIAAGLERKLHLDPAIREEIHTFMSNLFLKALQNELVPQLRREDIGEEEMRAHYDRFREAYKERDAVALSWIRTENRKKAEEIAEAIRSGRVTFESAAADAAVKAGSSPLRSVDRYPSELRSTIAALSIEETSLPVFRRGEYWLIRLDRIAAGKQLEFEDRREFIRNDVLYAKYRQEWDKAYETLRRKFGVEVDKKALLRFSDSFSASNLIPDRLAPEFAAEATQHQAQRDEGSRVQ